MKHVDLLYMQKKTNDQHKRKKQGGKCLQCFATVIPLHTELSAWMNAAALGLSKPGYECLQVSDASCHEAFCELA